jgi:hypothetical protein
MYKFFIRKDSPIKDYPWAVRRHVNSFPFFTATVSVFKTYEEALAYVIRFINPVKPA